MHDNGNASFDTSAMKGLKDSFKELFVSDLEKKLQSTEENILENAIVLRDGLSENGKSLKGLRGDLLNIAMFLTSDMDRIQEFVDGTLSDDNACSVETDSKLANITIALMKQAQKNRESAVDKILAGQAAMTEQNKLSNDNLIERLESTAKEMANLTAQKKLNLKIIIAVGFVIAILQIVNIIM